MRPDVGDQLAGDCQDKRVVSVAWISWAARVDLEQRCLLASQGQQV